MAPNPVFVLLDGGPAPCAGARWHSGPVAVIGWRRLLGDDDGYELRPGAVAGEIAAAETALAAFPPQPFGLLAARAHARIWAELAAAGQDVGAHDRLVAATAISGGWRVGTANLRHFDRIAGLDVLTVTFTGSPGLAGLPDR